MERRNKLEYQPRLTIFYFTQKDRYGNIILRRTMYPPSSSIDKYIKETGSFIIDGDYWMGEIHILTPSWMPNIHQRIQHKNSQTVDQEYDMYHMILSLLGYNDKTISSIIRKSQSIGRSSHDLFVERRAWSGDSFISPDEERQVYDKLINDKGKKYYKDHPNKIKYLEMLMKEEKENESQFEPNSHGVWRKQKSIKPKTKRKCRCKK